jgi:endonuclease III
VVDLRRALNDEAAMATSSKKKGTRGPTAAARKRALELHERLVRAIPRPHVELKFENAWELLIATILAAQSTDRTVNAVMPGLLARWPNPKALAGAAQEEVEEVVKSTGFFRNKAKAIRQTSQALVERFGGEVPRNMDELLELPGVARKTANVVLGAAHGIPAGIVVDVHCVRVSQRLGLTRHKQPEKIEQELCALFPEALWLTAGHRFTLHGRYVCTARAPRCGECPLNELCPSREAPPEETWTRRAERVALEMESRAEPFSRVGEGKGR